MSHAEALEKTLAALDLQPTDGALVELCRMTAKQMDTAEGAPSTRLSAIYLSLLRNVQKAGPKIERTDKLAEIRALRNLPTPSSKMKCSRSEGL